MVYPCENCIVDIMCLKCCDKFIWYMDEIKSTSVRNHLIKSESRYKRSRKSALLYQANIRLYGVLYQARNELLKLRNNYETR
jgi:hypothetical protein